MSVPRSRRRDIDSRSKDDPDRKSTLVYWSSTLITVPTELISISVTEVMTVGTGSPPITRLPRLSKTSMEHMVKAMPLFFFTVSSLQSCDKSRVMEKERGEHEQGEVRCEDDCDGDCWDCWDCCCCCCDSSCCCISCSAGSGRRCLRLPSSSARMADCAAVMVFPDRRGDIRILSPLPLIAVRATCVTANATRANASVVGFMMVFRRILKIRKSKRDRRGFYRRDAFYDYAMGRGGGEK
mmetsp:Transcript_19464/g.41631  ORF Transcript_19464/g.41631 Transcript_19464/m.41631 type:complete len:239 (+) Transcript_19464:366-1082(+)